MQINSDQEGIMIELKLPHNYTVLAEETMLALLVLKWYEIPLVSCLQ